MSDAVAVPDSAGSAATANNKSAKAPAGTVAAAAPFPAEIAAIPAKISSGAFHEPTEAEDEGTAFVNSICSARRDVSAVTCANCGRESSDVVNLKDCNACRLVKYCGVDCQRAHRKQHKKACKKRAAELKDERLYSQGLERPEGDYCPICTLAIPLPTAKHSLLNVCCMKRICIGCRIVAQTRGINDCPFCRSPYCIQNRKMMHVCLQ